MKKLYQQCLLFFLLFGTNQAFAQLTAALQPIKDNSLIETPDTNSNGAGPFLFAGKTGSSSSIRRALLQFDIAGNIPIGSIIDSVELQLYMDQAPNTQPETFNLHRVTTEWGEGNSTAIGGTGAPAQPNDATWHYAFYLNQLWNNAGGDFNSTIESSTSIGAVGAYVFPSNNSLVSTVQMWLDSAITNKGFILLGNETSNSTTKRFASRENLDSLLRPVLRIWYSTVNSNKYISTSSIPVISVFPNPSNLGMLYVNSNEVPIVSVQVVDLQGQVITPKTQHNIHQPQLQLDTSDLYSGAYLILIQTANHIITKQIIIP